MALAALSRRSRGALAALSGLLSAWTLLVLLSLPLAFRNFRDMWSGSEESVRELTYLVVRTAQLHLVFGVLLSVGIAVGALAGS